MNWHNLNPDKLKIFMLNPLNCSDFRIFSKIYHFNVPFILTTDASDLALEAVLSQKISEGGSLVERPISYDSRVLSATERNYSTIEKELLGLVWATKTFRSYLYGQKFTLVTDHRPLTFLSN